MNKYNLKKIVSCILKLKKRHKRLIIAIAGPPCAGKSTFSLDLIEYLNASSNFHIASLLTMDGFHYDNALLEKMNLLEKKGSPESFDINGFSSTLKRIAEAKEEVAVPLFDRKNDYSIANAQIIYPNTPIIIVEGNYLLLNTTKFSEVKFLYDISIFLSPSLETLKKRLIDRWIEEGLTLEQAIKRAETNDIPNAKFVLENSSMADILYLDNKIIFNKEKNNIEKSENATKKL